MGVTNYMTVNGKIRSEQRSGEAHSRDYVLDRLGSVIQIYQNGWPIADACYEPYGGIYTQWNMEGKTFTWLGGWGYRQTGVEWSSLYVRARHYSRGLSNWTSIDPLWPSEMPYGYVEGRVMTASDPSGLFNCDCRVTKRMKVETSLRIWRGGTFVYLGKTSWDSGMKGNSVSDDCGLCESLQTCPKSTNCWRQCSGTTVTYRKVTQILAGGSPRKIEKTIECVDKTSGSCKPLMGGAVAIAIVNEIPLVGGGIDILMQALDFCNETRTLTLDQASPLRTKFNGKDIVSYQYQASTRIEITFTCCECDAGRRIGNVDLTAPLGPPAPKQFLGGGQN